MGGPDDRIAFDVLMEIGVEQSSWITVVGRMILMQLLKQENGQRMVCRQDEGGKDKAFGVICSVFLRTSEVVRVGRRGVWEV